LPDFQITIYLKKAAKFVDAGKIDGIRFSTRPDTVDKDRLDLISPYPVTTIELGVQSMDDQVLKTANRGHTSADTINAVTLLKQKKYKTGLQMMTGLPGDSETKASDTARAIIALKPDFVRIYPTLVIKNSPLAKIYKKGLYVPLTLEDCVTQLKNLYLLFQKHQIPVIRMGLQASSELDSGDAVLAGPYHPALGHMVFSKIMLDKAKQLLSAKKTINDRMTISVHPANLSRMQGLHKNNLKILKQMFEIRTLIIKTDNKIPEDGIVIN
jgi:histone acetyltransferase (RNA polymerase elongator complex component)